MGSFGVFAELFRGAFGGGVGLAITASIIVVILEDACPLGVILVGAAMVDAIFKGDTLGVGFTEHDALLDLRFQGSPRAFRGAF